MISNAHWLSPVSSQIATCRVSGDVCFEGETRAFTECIRIVFSAFNNLNYALLLLLNYSILERIATAMYLHFDFLQYILVITCVCYVSLIDGILYTLTLYGLLFIMQYVFLLQSNMICSILRLIFYSV